MPCQNKEQLLLIGSAKDKVFECCRATDGSIDLRQITPDNPLLSNSTEIIQLLANGIPQGKLYDIFFTSAGGMNPTFNKDNHVPLPSTQIEAPLSEDERNRLIDIATYQYAIAELSRFGSLAAQSDHNIINPKKAEKTCQEYQCQFETTLDKLGLIPKYFTHKANEIIFKHQPMIEVSITDRISKYLEVKAEFEGK